MTHAVLSGFRLAFTESEPLDSAKAVARDAAAADATADGTFDTLYRANANRVYLLALRLSADPIDAADIAAEAFVRAWQSLSKFRGDSSDFTWLHSITVHAWRDLQRRRGRTREVAESSLSTSEARKYDIAAQHTTSDLLDLDRAIAALPAGAREVLVLRTISGYSTEEVAGQLGISIGTVKSQLSRARKLLLQSLNR